MIPLRACFIAFFAPAVFYTLPALAAPEAFATDASPQSRVPLPTPEARRQSLDRVREIFADEYAAAVAPAKKAECARRLMDQADSTVDPADRWTLLSEALRMATEGGDVAAALPLIERIPREFDVERNASRLEALGRLASKANQANGETLGEAVLAVARDADKAGDDEVAAKAVTLAMTVARKTKAAGVLADATKLQQASKDRQKLTRELEPLMRKIEQNPADTEANFEAGRILCLKADRWEEGLELLSMGSDAVLVRLARSELKNSAEPEDLMRLADGWWDWAETQRNPWKLPAQSRAVAIYGRVINDLQGLDKARVEKRIAAAVAAGGGTGDTMFLADLPEPDVKGVFNNFFSTNGTLGGPFEVAGKTFPKAITALPESYSASTVAYRLPVGAVRMRGRVGIFTPQHAKPKDQPAAPLTFQIVADGEVVWTSPPLQRRDDMAAFDVAIRNASRVELRTKCTGHNNNGWGAWLDPTIIK
jgi:hypothetical protein